MTKDLMNMITIKGHTKPTSKSPKTAKITIKMAGTIAPKVKLKGIGGDILLVRTARRPTTQQTCALLTPHAHFAG